MAHGKPSTGAVQKGCHSILLSPRRSHLSSEFALAVITCSRDNVSIKAKSCGFADTLSLFATLETGHYKLGG
jgi:hypothetical protein